MMPGLGRMIVGRICLAVGLAAFFCVGYFGLGSVFDARTALDLRTAWDDRIPFVASMVWVYLAIFPLALCPLVLVRCPSLLRRGTTAYLYVMSVSFLCYLLFPVTSADLRVGPEALDGSQMAAWAVGVVYRFDPPLNLFPSLHVSITSLAAFVVWKAWRFMGAILFAALGLVAMSVCMIKQHFLLDVLSGVVLAVIAALLFLRSYEPQPDAAPAGFQPRG